MPKTTTKITMKPGAFLNPVPVVMVSCGDAEQSNIITVAWAGTVNSDPPMLSVSIRKSRYSHGIISRTGAFVVNLVSEELTRAADFCGVKSGRDVDKFRELGLDRTLSPHLGVPMIDRSPINLECRVSRVLELGSHDLFLAEIVSVLVSDTLLDAQNALDLRKASLVAYSHGEYYALGRILGFFGYSVAGDEARKRRMRT